MLNSVPDGWVFMKPAQGCQGLMPVMPVLCLYLLNMILMTNVVKVPEWNNTSTLWQWYQNITALPALIFFYWLEKWIVTRESDRVGKAKKIEPIQGSFFFFFPLH